MSLKGQLLEALPSRRLPAVLAEVIDEKRRMAGWHLATAVAVAKVPCSHSEQFAPETLSTNRRNTRPSTSIRRFRS